MKHSSPEQHSTFYPNWFILKKLNTEIVHNLNRKFLSNRLNYNTKEYLTYQNWNDSNDTKYRVHLVIGL